MVRLSLQICVSLYPMLRALVFLLVSTATLAGGQHDVAAIAAVPLDPAAARIFPSAQFTAACGIITIQGLGSALDGDYSLVDDLALASGERPAWIGTTQDRQDLLLSWQPVARAWTIGIRGLSGAAYCASVQSDFNLPPAHSSRWRLLGEDRHIAEEVDHVVSIYCPGTVVLVLTSTLYLFMNA